MLIDFRVENYLSFKEGCTISAEATSEKQHVDRLSEGPLPRLKLLPTGAIFGGNGSGKSNLVKALHFCRHMIMTGVSPEEPLPLQTFKLDSKSLKAPSRFTLRFLMKEQVFEYSFACTRNAILSESLRQIKPRSELLIFEREVNGEPAWNLGALDKLPKQEREFVKFKTRDTLPNQLFLQEMRGKDIALLDAAIAWFRDCLEVVQPDTSILPDEIIGPDEQLEGFATSMLRHADTGIARVCFEPLDPGQIDPALLNRARQELKQENMIHIARSADGRRLRFRLRGDDILADRLVTFHRSGKGEEVRFEIEEESHGTRRLIDLLPLFYGLVAPQSHKVFVCDELDSNLHPLILQALLKEFLERGGPERRAQLILTTHDVTLFDQYLLRRDELWMCSKKSDGATYLESLGDYKDVRVGTDILKGYLLGRYTGVPRVTELFESKDH